MIVNVLEMLERAAEKTPDKTALKDAENEITYKELVSQAKQIGSYICRMHPGAKRQPVAVCIDRDIRSIVQFLGVVYSGNFYVPLDMSMPAERIQLILDDLQPIMQLTKDMEELNSEPVDEAVLKANRLLAIDTDPLYAIFTSGSTGRPKGVLVSHRSVIDLVEQFAVTFPFPKDAVFGNQAPFDFDVSVKDIYDCFYQGATLVVIPKQLFSMPLKLVDYLNENQINTIIWAVSAMRIVENFKTFTKAVPQYLKLIMFSGEIMPVRVLQYWQTVLPETVFVNLYGPTEITCNCTYYIVDREFKLDESIPIGKPFRNTQILLLDQATGTCINIPNVEGEICVRGTCLALGYYGAEEKTKEAFVQNPAVTAYEEKIYRTGDLGYYDDNGLLYFVSRKDYQIKHMGHRIELGEIEVLVNAISYLDAAVCVFDTKHEKIVLCYQPNEEAKKFSSEREIWQDIVKVLSTKLPKFMWPNRYVMYETLPVNKNGKIDRVALKKEMEEK